MKIYLDLLPKERKQELKRKKIFRKILRQEILFLVPLFVFIIILSNIYYLLSLQHSTSIAAQSQEQSQDKYQELKTYEEKFKQVNESTASLLKIQAGHLNWNNIFKKLDEATPEGIVITNFSTREYLIMLAGKAKDRNTLLSYKDKLESTECFTAVNVPLSNLVVKDDVDFQIDFSVNQDCLKKQ
jgi:Tfp pilus assembly protein PilN